MTRPDRHPRRNAAMPDRAHLELRVDPAPVRRHEPPSRWNALVWILLGLAWVVAFVVAALIVASIARSLVEAPRGAQTTDLAPSRDLSATPGPSAGLPGVSRSQAESRHPAGGESTLVAGAQRFRGLATWCAPTPDHCRGWDEQYVGAVPSFRFGDEPYAVQVCLATEPATCTHVVVTSYCACGDRRGQPTVIDLSVPAFRELAPLSRGVIAVIVSNPIDVPVGPTLPPTDQEMP